MSLHADHNVRADGARNEATGRERGSAGLPMKMGLACAALALAVGLVAVVASPASAAPATQKQPTFSGSTTFTGNNGLPSFSYTQGVTIPVVNCNLSLTESGSAGNGQWDFPMGVNGGLSSSPVVGQADSGGMTVTPQSPSGNSYQISLGVGLSLDVCGIGASTGLGLGAATDAPAPMPGQTLNVPVTGSCPGYGPSFSIGVASVSLEVTVCPVTTLSGGPVNAGLGGSAAAVSPSSVALSPSSSSISATPQATQFGVGLSNLSYNAPLSEGLDVNVTYSVCLVIVGCTSGNLYTSPTLDIVNGSNQSSTGSPSSLTFAMTAAPGTSSVALGVSATPTVGMPATLTGTVSPALNDGRLRFSVDRKSVGYCIPSAGTCSITFKPRTAGLHKVAVWWTGDANYTRSHHLMTVYVRKAASTTTLMLSKATVLVGHESNEVFRVSVSPAAAMKATGSVKVYEGVTTLCTVVLSWGMGTCSPSASALAGGTYHVIAKYLGDSNVAQSQSHSAKFVVG